MIIRLEFLINSSISTATGGSIRSKSSIKKTNPKLLKEWSKYKRNFINWYGEEKSDEIIKKLGL